MKNLITFLVLTILVFGNVNYSTASHILGGEITWVCIKNGSNAGEFVFRLKLYRACSGISLPNITQINNPLYVSYGGPSVIPVAKVSQTDLSPPCFDSTFMVNCQNATVTSEAIQEYVLQSDTIQLNGIPDSSGSSFWWSSCCRPASTLMRNINGSGYWLRAVMFPYVDPVTNNTLLVGSTSLGPKCYDSSPEFIQRPASVLCLRSNNVYEHYTYDYDYDFVKYSWSTPRQTSSTPVTYKTGYRDTLQLPNKNHHTFNADPILDTAVGDITFYTYAYTPPGGYHSIGVKVSSYKNGQKVAEIYRDIALILTDCDTISSSPQVANHSKPQIEIKRSTSPTYLTSFNDTFVVGSVIDLNIRASDYDSLPTAPISLQSVDLWVEGIAMSDKPNDQTKCNIQPCAYLDSVTPTWNSRVFQDTSVVEVDFTWNTSCNLLASYGPYGPNQRFKTYQFVVKAKDNWCPVPGRNLKSFAITLIDTNGPEMEIQHLDASGVGTEISWNRYTLPDFNRYNIYRRYNLLDPWMYVSSIYSHLTTNYLDVNSRPDSLPVYYMIDVNNGNGCSKSNVENRTIRLNVLNSSNYAGLIWNSSPSYPNTTGLNYIYRRDTLGKYQLLDSVLLSQSTFLDLNPIYSHFIAYKILSVESHGYYSVSTIDSIWIDKPVSPPDTTQDTTHIGINSFRIEPFKVNPNPFDNILEIVNGGSGNVRLEIFDINGKLWIQRTFEKSVTLNTSELRHGIYFIKLTDSEGEIYTHKLLKANE